MIGGSSMIPFELCWYEESGEISPEAWAKVALYETFRALGAKNPGDISGPGGTGHHETILSGEVCSPLSADIQSEVEPDD